MFVLVGIALTAGWSNSIFLEQQTLEFSNSSLSHRSAGAWPGALFHEIPQIWLLRRGDVSFWAPGCCCFALRMTCSCVCSMALGSHHSMVQDFMRSRRVCCMMESVLALSSLKFTKIWFTEVASGLMLAWGNRKGVVDCARHYKAKMCSGSMGSLPPNKD